VAVHLVSPWNTEASQPQLPRFGPDGQPSERPHLVRNLSKDNSKFSGMAGRSWARMPAPTFVISVTAHGRTPVCGPKNRNASLPIFVLPIDRRSSIVRVLNDPLVDPVSPVVPSPDAADNKPARDRSPRNDDSPEVPNLCPGGPGRPVQDLKIVVALRGHLRRPIPSVRARGASCLRAVTANRSSSRTCLLSRCHWRNRLARSPCEADDFGVLSFDARRELEEIILLTRLPLPS
jgi:hypothetical protein